MFIENFQRAAGSLDAGGYHIGFEGVYVWVSVCGESFRAPTVGNGIGAVRRG